MFGNLSIRSKLVGPLAVAVAATALLAVAEVAAGVGDRARAGQDRRLAIVAVRAAAAAHELQEERVVAAGRPAAAGRGEPELRAQRRRADRVVAAYRASAAGLGPTGVPALDRVRTVAGDRLARLPQARAESDRRPPAPGRVEAGHDAAVAGLLEVHHALAERVTAPGPAGWSRFQLAVAEAKEATGQVRTLLAGGAEPPPARLLAEVAVAGRELDGVRAAAGGRLAQVDAALAAPAVRRGRQVEAELLDPAPAGPAGGRGQAPGRPSAADLGQLRAGLDARAAALGRLERELAGDLTGLADARLRRQEARLRNRVVVAAAVALAVPALAFLLLGGGARRRAEAPAAGGTVAGLARRGQALLERQAQLVQELAREEPDPDRRLDLARVGHLTARQRRGAELLLSLAGPGPSRQRDRPLPLDALLRAAVADLDPQGPGGPRRGAQGRRERRVDLLAVGEVEVAGPAAADLVHLVAELVDNAAAFSPPAAPVTVTGGRDGSGWLVEVSDRGLGMTDEELAWANQRLAGGQPADPADLAAGDRLGLVVAGRLAARHGIGVRLTRSAAGGVTATVRLPAALLARPAPAPARAR